jgi:hypothetical protein
MPGVVLQHREVAGSLFECLDRNPKRNSTTRASGSRQGTTGGYARSDLPCAS